MRRLILPLLMSFVGPALTAAQVPDFDKSQFTTASITSHAIEIVQGESCYDINDRYLAISTKQYSNDSRDAKVSTTVSIYDLASGERLQKIDLMDVAGRVVSIHPDGDRILFQPESENGVRLLDISGGFQLVKRIGHHYSGFGQPKAVYFFANQDRIVAKEPGRSIFRIYNGETGVLMRSLGKHVSVSGRPQMSPDRRFLITSETDRESGNAILRFSDLYQSVPASDLKLDVAASKCLDPRLSPDGTKVVSYSNDGTAACIVRGFNTGNGDCRFEIPIPVQARRKGGLQIRWLGNDHFLVGEILVSFDQQKLLGRLGGFRPEHIVESTGNALLFRKTARKTYLESTSVVRDLQQDLDEATPVTETLFERGDSVSVIYELPQDVPIRDIEDRFELALYQALTGAGYQLRKEADVKMTVVVGEKRTGKTLRLVSPGSESMHVSEVNLICRISLSGPSGVPFHKKEIKFHCSPAKISARDKQSLVERMSRWRWERLLEISEKEFSSAYYRFEVPVLRLGSGSRRSE